MKLYNISSERYINFMTPCPECDPPINQNSINPGQFEDLQELINLSTKVKLESINKKREKIHQRALAIQKENTIIEMVDDTKP